jgi:hypothetical protein
MTESEITSIIFTQGIWDDISSKFAYLQTLINDLQYDKEQLEKESADTREQVAILQATVLECLTRIQQLETRSTSSRSHEPKIADPPMFMDERKAILSFLAKCRLKFSGQPSIFPTE